jgi:hypothetical protein
MKRRMKNFFLIMMYWTWCLPQTLLGFCVLLFFRLVDKRISVVPYQSESLLIYSEKMQGGLSLGRYLFSGRYSEPFATHLAKHEYGHCLQSFRLGWLYLVVIGIPSAAWAMMHGWRYFSGISYYKFYTERWANHLGKTDAV